jgi:hypothetical protein
MKKNPRTKKKRNHGANLSFSFFFSQYSSPIRDYLSILKYGMERLMIS